MCFIEFCSKEYKRWQIYCKKVKESEILRTCDAFGAKNRQSWEAQFQAESMQ